MLEIVPQDRNAAVELRISPDQIDDINLGQLADVVPVGMGMQLTRRLSGTVQQISAAAVPDERSGQEFFRVELAVAMDEFTQAGVDPIPGMPLEIYLTTGDHTVMSYLLEPLTAHLRRAFRE